MFVSHNKRFGFYGTFRSVLENLFKKSFNEVILDQYFDDMASAITMEVFGVVNKFFGNKVAEMLDSANGRHIADDFIVTLKQFLVFDDDVTDGSGIEQYNKLFDKKFVLAVNDFMETRLGFYINRGWIKSVMEEYRFRRTNNR